MRILLLTPFALIALSQLLALAALFGRKLVDFDVHIEQVLHRVRLQLLLVAKATPAECQQTKLLAPVTQVVQALHVPAIGLVQIRQERTDDRATQMTSVEGLGDIRRRKLYQARLALAGIVGAVRRLLLAVGIERCTLAVRQRMHRQRVQLVHRDAPLPVAAQLAAATMATCSDSTRGRRLCAAIQPSR